MADRSRRRRRASQDSEEEEEESGSDSTGSAERPAPPDRTEGREVAPRRAEAAAREGKESEPKGRHPRKLWKDEGRWEHDRFREDEQAPKSRDELIAMYGYDIRSCKNPEEIRPRRPRKPRYSSPQREDQEEKPSRPSNRYQESNSAPPPRTYNNRSAPNNSRAPPNRTYTRPGYKENRPAAYLPDNGAATHSTTERRQDYGGYRGRSIEQTQPQPSESSAEVQNKAEPAIDKQAEDPSPPPPDRPVEKKSYSRARRSRIKGGESGKSIDDTTFPDLPPPPLPQIPTEVVPEPSPPIPVVKPGGWEPPVDGGVTGLEQDMSQVNISDQNWSPGQSYIPARGIPNHIHMAGGPPQYNRMDGMVSQA
ncbi:hypothetical protein GDO78_004436 [Eleutherodactylus coqui]|uniref:Protein CASC3 n=1 Tax=Eleutherodactylus coqui TaxID=57060 RepID=A0A8J6JZT2_ELECQ|nr:hypothetical protein GDO78_004436 [Eleutherodactylus coqui]